MRWRLRKPCSKSGVRLHDGISEGCLLLDDDGAGRFGQPHFYPCRVIGRDRVPRQGGFILAGNHESNIDPVLLPVACPRRIRFMAKEELFRHPVLGALIRFGGGFPVRRTGADRRALAEFVRQMETGFPVLIFPQGTRGGERIQSGVGFLAVTSGKPVVPVFIHGSDRVLPKGRVWPRRSPVKVVFGRPLILAEDLSYAEAAAQVMAAIRELRKECC